MVKESTQSKETRARLPGTREDNRERITHRTTESLALRTSANRNLARAADGRGSRGVAGLFCSRCSGGRREKGERGKQSTGARRHAHEMRRQPAHVHTTGARPRHIPLFLPDAHAETDETRDHACFCHTRPSRSGFPPRIPLLLCTVLGPARDGGYAVLRAPICT